MKAMVVREYGAGFFLEEVQIAAPVGREVLVDVKASGLCHSDVSAMKYDLGFPAPSVLGHEAAGIVAAVGPDVTEFFPGDHVVGCLVQYCGKCKQCITGNVGLCLHPEATVRAEGEVSRLSSEGGALTQGMGLGGFAEQALVHENQLVKLPESMPWAQAALLGCGVATGAGAVLTAAKVPQGSSVAIIGAGGVGLNAISGAVIAGASKIIVIDITDDKLETAKKFGATDVVNSATEDAVARVIELTGGVDYAFDFVGFAPTAQSGWDMLAKGGELYLIGLGSPTSELNLKLVDAITTRKSVHGVYMGSTNPKRDLAMYADLYLQGRFNLDDLVSKEISLSEVNEGYESLKEPGMNRVVITSFA